MRKTYCDRCGKELDRTNPQYILLPLKLSREIAKDHEIREILFNGYEVGEVELCNDCVIELANRVEDFLESPNKE